MFTIQANSIRDDRPIDLPGGFVNPAAARKHVVKELRGVSTYHQVWILNSEGERVVRGYRAGLNGTGNTWVWRNLDGDDADRD